MTGIERSDLGQLIGLGNLQDVGSDVDRSGWKTRAISRGDPRCPAREYDYRVGKSQQARHLHRRPVAVLARHHSSGSRENDYQGRTVGMTGRAVVFGAPRSGTTFLMKALNPLPEAECVTGNLFPAELAHLAAQEDLPEETRAVLERSLRGAFRGYLDSGLYRSRTAALRKWLATRKSSQFWAATHGARRERLLVYKEPFFAFSPGFVFNALPDARLIYIMRDGRDVADSLVRTYDVLSDDKLASLETVSPLGRRHGNLYVPWWVERGQDQAFIEASQFARALWMWREMVRRSQQFLNRDDVRASGRVLTIRYRELMADPIGRGEAITNHLGVTMNRRVTKRFREAHERSIGIHKRRDKTTVRRAEEVAQPQLRDLGYV